MSTQYQSLCSAERAFNVEPAMGDTSGALDVLLERDDLVVVNKVAGQPTFPHRRSESGTLANLLVGRYPEMAGVGYSPREPGILHRLDTNTSGVLLAARSSGSFDALRRCLKAGLIRKEYYLICDGDSLPDSGVIDIPIGSRRRSASRVAACIHLRDARRYKARPARTHFRVVQRHEKWALVLASAAVAVRHQIRAHFAAIGHPLAGDGLYGGDVRCIKRHALHARLIAIDEFEGVEPFEVVCGMPEDMVELLRA